MNKADKIIVFWNSVWKDRSLNKKFYFYFIYYILNMYTDRHIRKNELDPL